MKIFLLFINLIIISLSSFAQENFLIGKWKFEKIPDHIKIDEQGLKLSQDFFKDMTISFDDKNYTQFMMNKIENGNWAKLNDDYYEFNSSKGLKYKVKLTSVSKNQIIYNINNREFQLIKVDEKPEIMISENSIEKIKGIDIDSNKIYGKWFYNGRIKNGKESDLILKHNENEIVNYTFKKDGEFNNRAILEIELIGLWSIDKDKQTIIIESENKLEYIKVVKLNEAELHLYNPKNDTILKFKR